MTAPDRLADLAAASCAGESFPAVAAALIERGVERYHVDFAEGRMVYFFADGSVEAHQGLKAEPAPRFSAEGVAAAIAASQRGETRFPEFARRAAAAGCAGYVLSFVGRRALYFGRDAGAHVEMLPATI